MCQFKKTKRFKERKPGPGEVVYRVKVRTGNVNNAGTDDSVYLTINGKRGDLTRKRLFNKYESIKTDDGYKFRFQRNSTNVFKLIGIDVGQLTHIVIEVSKNSTNQPFKSSNSIKFSYLTNSTMDKK